MRLFEFKVVEDMPMDGSARSAVMAQLRDRGCADKYRGAVSRCISSRWGSASRLAIRRRSRRRPHEKCAAERLAGGATTVPPPHPGQRNSSPSTAPRAHRRIHASPRRRSVRGRSGANREVPIAASVRGLRLGLRERRPPQSAVSQPISDASHSASSPSSSSTRPSAPCSGSACR